MDHYKYSDNDFSIDFVNMLENEDFEIALAAVTAKKQNNALSTQDKNLLVETFDQFMESRTIRGRFYIEEKLSVLLKIKTELLTRTSEKAHKYEELLHDEIRVTLAANKPLSNLLQRPFSFVVDSERGPTQFSTSRALKVYRSLLKSMPQEEAWTIHRKQHFFFQQLPYTKFYQRHILAEFVNPF